MNKDKDAIAIILGKMKGKGKERDSMESDEDGKEAAAEDLLDAIETKSAAGVVSAIEALLDLCYQEK